MNGTSMIQPVARLITVGLCMLYAGLPTPAAAATRPPPGIVFILADDIGWTDVACFGSDFYRTPHIDRLAAEGMKFTDSYAACHVCSPTRASIMTGKYPARLHLTDYIAGGRDRGLRSPDWTKFLPLDEVTIAEALKAKGYICGHFGKWHLNKDKNYCGGRPGDPASQGFDDVLTTVKPRRSASPTDDPHHVHEITDRAVEFIERNRDRPFFCYVTHNTLHRPIIGHPEIVREYEQRLQPGLRHDNPIYAAMVHDLDQSVGRIMDTLRELELEEETLVVFTGDNGGLLGDEKDRGTSNQPLRGGKGTDYEGGVRVPTIVRWPPVVAAGTVCDEPIISTDFFATLADAADLEPREAAGSEIDGVSIRPLLENPDARLRREAIYWHYPHYHAQGATPHGAIRAGDWKLIEFFEDMHVELYNLKYDIGEQHDLSDARPEVSERLRERLHRWRAEVCAQMPLSPKS